MAEQKASEVFTHNSDEENSDNGMGLLTWFFILMLLTFFMGNANSGGLVTRTEYTENDIISSETISSQTVSYTQADLDNFLMLVLCESGNQSTECMTAVAATVINRVEVNFGSTITSVITAPNQFAVYNYGRFCVGGVPVTLDYFYDDQIERARTAINSALAGHDPTGPVGGALYFYGLDGLTAEEASYRATISQKMQIGDLYFYRIWD